MEKFPLSLRSLSAYDVTGGLEVCRIVSVTPFTNQMEPRSWGELSSKAPHSHTEAPVGYTRRWLLHHLP